MFRLQVSAEGKNITVFIFVPQPESIVMFVEDVVLSFFVLKRQKKDELLAMMIILVYTRM